MEKRAQYQEELESRIARMCRLSAEGYKSTPMERHRLEGFIQAGVFLGLTSNSDVQTLLDKVYLAVCGKPLKEAGAHVIEWEANSNSYKHYEAPAYLRNPK
jgi:hypothetical protein